MLPVSLPRYVGGMGNSVYHFTDTCRLPWIIESGALKASPNFVPSMPDDFIWATTSDKGSRSASPMMQGDIYRRGSILLIRLTLDADDFTPWPEAAVAAGWTPNQIAILEKRASGDTPRDWLCRSDPLPLSRVRSAHAKSWSNPRWMPIDATEEYCIRQDDQTRAFVVNGRAYGATQFVDPLGRTGYRNLFIQRRRTGLTLGASPRVETTPLGVACYSRFRISRMAR